MPSYLLRLPPPGRLQLLSALSLTHVCQGCQLLSRAPKLNGTSSRLFFLLSTPKSLTGLPPAAARWRQCAAPPPFAISISLTNFIKKVVSTASYRMSPLWISIQICYIHMIDWTDIFVIIMYLFFLPNRSYLSKSGCRHLSI